MLYINVYLIAHLYGGPEEGGWYYDAGTPLGSIPIPTSKERGKEFFCTEDGIHIRECQTCKGTGKAVVEDETNGLSYSDVCPDCEEIPEDVPATWKMIQKYQDMFAREPGRYERIQVMLQPKFAVSFPDQKPHYE